MQISNMFCCVCNITTISCEIMGIYDDEHLKMAEIIEQHLWLKPQSDDEFKSKICRRCWDIVKDFHEFYESTEKAHKEFQALQSENFIKVEDPPSGAQIKEEMEETCEEKIMQIEVEIDSNIQISPIVDISLHKNPLADDQPCQNDNSENESDDNCAMPEDYSSSSSSFSAGSDEEEEDSPKDLKLSEVRKRVGCAKTTRTRKVAKTKSRESKKDNESATKKKRKRLDPKLTEEMIKKHIPMICNLCNFDCKFFHDVAKHFKEYHSKIKPFIMCCGKRFTRRHYIAQHALQHEDPNCFRCNECNKSFKTTYNLHTHNLSFHQQKEDGIHACEFCEQKFARRKLLEFHKPTHIPKDQWSFFCMKCPTPRPFASEYLLKTHESVHKRETNICHVCAKEIKDKYLFEKHVRLHFEDSGPRVKCPYPDCESWLKDEYNLKDHLRRHNSKGIIYKCPECDKTCKNSKALAQHKRNNHSNKVYKCGQCEKTFKKAITLKEHTAHHTGESLYKCPFCPRTFNSNANMYSHKKKQHPVVEK